MEVGCPGYPGLFRLEGVILMSFSFGSLKSRMFVYTMLFNLHAFIKMHPGEPMACSYEKFF